MVKSFPSSTTDSILVNILKQLFELKQFFQFIDLLMMDSQSDVKQEKPTKEQKILEMAKKELLRDIKCASMRAEQFGAHSWAKPQKFVPSKRFLRHMLVSASRDNLRKTEKRKGNKTSKVTSAILQSSCKNDNVSSKDKSRKRKNSRWDTSPQANNPNLDSKHYKKRRHDHHHHVKTKQKNNKK